MGNKYTYLLIVILVLIIIPLIVAQPVYKTETDIVLSVPCTIDGEYCSTNTTCVTTIINPDGDVLVNDGVMIQDNAVFEYNLFANQTDINGEYELNLACCDGSDCFSKNLPFFITPNGELATTSKGFIYMGLLLALLVFFILLVIGGVKAEGVVGKTALFLTAYLFLIGISFISWNLSLDYLTSSPFTISFFRIIWLFLMYALFPVILVSTFYTLVMIRNIKEIQNLIDKGMPVDEAYERQVRGGMRSIFKQR